MGISAKEVNELRKKTGAGIMDCKKALTASEGDMDGAIEYLRKKGQKVAELRAGRDANEGAVIATVNAEANRGVIVYLACETDFVAKNDDFVAFAKSLASHALAENIDSYDALMASSLDGKSVADHVAERVGMIGESISIKAFHALEAAKVVPYIHAGNRIGVLLGLSKDVGGATEVGRDVGMQVAAMRPIGLDESNIPEDVREREIQIARDKALQDNKPEHIIDKIAEGSLKKFYKENTLVHQSFVKDPSLTVAQYVQKLDKELSITAFLRCELGE